MKPMLKLELIPILSKENYQSLSIIMNSVTKLRLKKLLNSMNMGA